MFTYNDVSVNYEFIDNKKDLTLIYLHGWGQNIEMMIPIAKPFTKDYNVLIIDLPGFGKSSEPKSIWSLDDYSELIHEFVKQLKLKKVVLIGHSFGGKISIVYASKYKVEKLILLSSPYKVEIKKQPFKVKVLKRLAKFPGFKNLANYFKKKIGSTDYKNASPMMRDILVKHVNTDLTDELKKISAPTIIIWGTNDVTVDISSAYEIEKLIKDAAVIAYEGLTHFAYLEDKQKTINIIKSFIG